MRACLTDRLTDHEIERQTDLRTDWQMFLCMYFFRINPLSTNYANRTSYASYVEWGKVKASGIENVSSVFLSGDIGTLFLIAGMVFLETLSNKVLIKHSGLYTGYFFCTSFFNKKYAIDSRRECLTVAQLNLVWDDSSRSDLLIFFIHNVNKVIFHDDVCVHLLFLIIQSTFYDVC